MQFTINQSTLITALTKIVGIPSNRHMAILGCVRLSINNGAMFLRVDNLETVMELKVECDVKAPGTTCVPAKRLTDVVKNCPDDQITGSYNHDTLKLSIRSGSASFQLSCMDANDFPDRQMGSDELLYVDASSLLTALDHVTYASSTDDSRFGLNSVCCERKDEQTQVTATDGHRLARAIVKLDLPGAGEKQKTLIPRIAVGHIRKLTKTGIWQVAFDDKHCFLKTADTSASFRLLTSEYPNADQVVPSTCGFMITVSRQTLLNAVQRVALFTSEHNRGLTFTLETGALTITAKHPDLGEGNDVVDVCYEGEPVTWLMNGTYLTETLRSFDIGEVRMEFVDTKMDGNPIVFRPMECDDKVDCFGLIMPMRK